MQIRYVCYNFKYQHSKKVHFYRYSSLKRLLISHDCECHRMLKRLSYVT